MTRKDYTAIAEVLNEARKLEGSAPDYGVVDTIVTGLCHVFQEDNPSFDRTRFIAAVKKVN